ncbi:MAG: tetratricopeptide repeat protein [Candidatus Omnitrophica bacterium]|nr:tetratricopeptide repeat protein [Candidatus Omnitrophota bacterium]
MLKEKVESFSFRSWLKKHWKTAVFLILLVCLAYANSLNSDFVSDDTRSILDNKSLDKASYIFNQPKVTLSSLFYFVINKAVGRVPLFYRLVNICFQLGVVLVVFFLFSFLTDAKTAFFAASILAVHPLLTESVSWISGGSYAQYSFFVLFALLAYSLSIRNRKWFLVSIFSFILSLFSHDMAIVFPLILLIFVIAFADIRRDWKKLIPFFALSIIAGLIYFGRIGQRLTNFQMDFYQKPQLLNPFLQIPIAITSYLELIFWPKGLTLYHSEMTFSQMQYIARLLVFIIFLAIIVYSFRRSRSVFFGFCLFVISLLPALTPLGITWIVAERYVYLGSIGIFIAVASGINKLEKIEQLKIPVWIFFFLIMAVLLTRTVLRNIDWKNEDNLWTATAKTSPSSPNTHNNLGDVYSRHGELEKAVGEFKKAIEIKPDYADAYHNLAHTYYQMSRYPEAIENLKKAVYLNPRLWQSYQCLGVIYFQEKQYSPARDYFKKAIEINPQEPSLHNNLGIVYILMNDKSKAEEEFEKTLQIDSDNQVAKQALSLLR